MSNGKRITSHNKTRKMNAVEKELAKKQKMEAKEAEKARKLQAKELKKKQRKVKLDTAKEIESQMIKFSPKEIDELGVYQGDDSDEEKFDEAIIQKFTGCKKIKTIKAQKYLEEMYA